MAKYQVDPDRSQLIAEARSNVHPIRIETAGIEGFIEIDVDGERLVLDEPPRALLEIGADRMRSGVQLYDLEVQRMIEVRKYPQLRGELVDMKEQSSGRYRLRGKLSFHGVTNEVEGDVTVRVRGDELEVEGEQTFDMRDFNLEPPKILMLRVMPDIRVRAKVIAVRS